MTIAQRIAKRASKRLLDAEDAGGVALLRSLDFYGQNSDFYDYDGFEAVLSGPYETGKTITALQKFHQFAIDNPGSNNLMVRKVYKDLRYSAVRTYEDKILVESPDMPNAGVKKYGGKMPQMYTYPNGSTIVVAGLDNPGKALSAEYDAIYINQMEELTLNDYEMLTPRATGRAGHTDNPQLFGDCNPGPPTHWIRGRPELKMFESRHEDNPALFDHDTGEWTAQGVRSIGVLDALTGVRYKRGRLGLWVANTGQVYEQFIPAVHVIKPFDLPHDWNRYRAIDFGYTNPFVCQWWAEDHDGRLYMYREIYMTQRTVKVHSGDIKRWTGNERILRSPADHDAEDRATLDENGIGTENAVKDISRGIQAVQERLKIQGDGKPRLFVFKDALVEPDQTLRERYKPVSTEQEFTEYIWPESKDGKSDKEVPIDDNNHGMDALRYMVMALDDGNQMAKPFRMNVNF